MNLLAIKVQADRLQKDLLNLAEYGQEPDGGMMRTALSDADLEARRWFKSRMKESGLHVREDAAANIIGRLDPTEGPTDAPCIAIGSHIDTVLHGGKFDGALGICGGLEAIRAIQESGLFIPCPIELFVFTDEEGGHFAGTFGSRAIFKMLVDNEIHRSKGSGLPSIAQDLKRMGKDINSFDDVVRSPSEFRAFLELHIEQGPVLESIGVPIGIVEGIVASERYIIKVKGRAGHAGTTPMHLRDDALVKAARIITSLNNTIISIGSDFVGTMGQVVVKPGAFNIIPGSVNIFLEIRSFREVIITLGREAVQGVIRSFDNVHVEPVVSKGCVASDLAIMDMAELSCRERGIRFHRMGSAAGHDARTFAQQGVPTGMIFIPCKEGRSHCPEESINWDDAAVGAQILADTVLRIGSETK